MVHSPPPPKPPNVFINQEISAFTEGGTISTASISKQSCTALDFAPGIRRNDSPISATTVTNGGRYSCSVSVQYQSVFTWLDKVQPPSRGAPVSPCAKALEKHVITSMVATSATVNMRIFIRITTGSVKVSRQLLQQSKTGWMPGIPGNPH